MKNDRLSPEELENNRKKLEEERPRLVILLLQWLLPPFILNGLPLAEKRNLALVPLWVFIFGISLPLSISLIETY